MIISAFGDETASDFAEQLCILADLNIRHIDVRAAWDVNCSLFTDQHITRLRSLCQAHGVEVACMGSPIGKSPIDADIAIESERLKTIGATAQALGTRKIRIFSFYPAGAQDTAALQQSIDRLGALTGIAAEQGLQLLLENEKGVVGDLPERCLALLQAIDSPHFRFIWDPANFVQCGAARHVEQWWDALRPYIGYIHIKDAKLPEGANGQGRSQVTVAGGGDGQVALLLARLRDWGYAGVLSLEPHLLEARRSSGFSGADGMAMAVAALRELMAEAGIREG
ncbi:MAG: sugar phosphate isomerase/epimerase [Chloroflexi bacterium]|nr:sugar phosphate isomerase/epimerase [Chloroflexota bacterium]MYI42270.1 sugar phosphate isomerase/epimerase [Chloroflexota bacterium]